MTDSTIDLMQQVVKGRDRNFITAPGLDVTACIAASITAVPHLHVNLLLW